MRPIDDPLTLATRQTAALLNRKVALDTIDRECRRQSLEALARSIELLAVPIYGPLWISSEGKRPEDRDR